MIPTIEEILEQYRLGSCTLDMALQWIGATIDSAVDLTALRDSFASLIEVGRDQDGNLLQESVVAVMGEPRPRGGSTTKERFEWWCQAEARIRFAKAEAMIEARKL